MAHYLIQAAYTPESWGAQTERPEDPVERLRPLTDKLGGRFDAFFYAFGEYDVVGIVEFPDDDAVAAWSIAASAGGAVRSIKTTKLLTVDQGMNALRKAQAARTAYRAPGARQLAGV